MVVSRIRERTDLGMPDHEQPNARGLFGGVFARGGVEADDTAWLQAMLDAEAGLARALERAGLAPAGAGEAVTAAAQGGNFDIERARRARRADREPGARAGPRAGAAGAPDRRSAPSIAAPPARTSWTPPRCCWPGGPSTSSLADLARAADAAAGLAAEHRSTIMIGRTLLQQAVPVTFGLVAAGWLTSVDEARAGLDAVGPRLAVQFGGAAGTLASLGDAGQRVAALLAEELGLAAARAALAHRPAADHRPGRRAGPGHGRARQDRQGRHAAGPVRGRRGQRGQPLRPGAGRSARVRRPGPAASPRRGGSSAMPHKHNPVASIAILGCTRQVPGLLATLAAAAEQEHQRAAGAWHAEWEPLTALLRLTGSASSWAAELLSGLTVDTSRMAANLAATKGLPLAEHVTSLLAGVLGAAQAHDLVAEAGDAGGQRRAAAARRAAVRAQARGTARRRPASPPSRSTPRSSRPATWAPPMPSSPRRSTPTKP